MGFKSYFVAKKVEPKKEEDVITHEPKTTPTSATPRIMSSTGTPSGAPPTMSEALKSEIQIEYLHQQQQMRLWSSNGQDEGVILKKTRGQYTCRPMEIADEENGLFQAIQYLNVKSAMTVFTRVTQFSLMKNDQRPFVQLSSGLRLQVLPNVSYLMRCQKHQFAALIADKGMLVVWDDEPKHLHIRAEETLNALMEVAWAETEEVFDEKKDAANDITEVETNSDVDVEGAADKPRRTLLIQTVMTALVLMITTIVIGAGFSKVAVEIYEDGSYMRLALLVTVPPQIWLSLFFFQALVCNLVQICGPISQITENSKFYSGKAPKRLRSDNGPLPHVTIQMPVYKEGLDGVIKPTIHSIKAAISTYEMQGGTANIFINDDGMQLIPEDEARARQDFYDEHNIGWVARPRHDPRGEHGEVFVRAGKFKKASNMNYAMWVSSRVEDKLNAIERSANWSQDDEGYAYAEALQEVVKEDEGRTWTDGNIRMGDYILIIDSDTRVPTDCLIDAVSEMAESPEVGIIQYNSGVMNVTDSFFERGITFFTNLIYTQIKYAVSNGDVAPFVGHNAVLRWSALQDIAYEGPAEFDNREMWWSESTVSEDFDMALRLQAVGYIVRYAAYQGDGFKEGVSLTVYDELARWEKYAYGCSELIFHPLRYWFTRGPFTLLFRRFIMSNMPLPSKITILSYIGTYYALASALPLTVMNYFVMGWFNGNLDHYYMDSFKVFIALIVVFNALGNVSLAVIRYRISEKALLPALIENFSWVLMMSIFLGGISLHVAQAILSHLFGIDMNWGATSKEAENTTFFEEIPKVLKNFKFTFLFCFLMAGCMVACAVALPWMWQIHLFIAIFPISLITVNHFLLPIVLNPSLMLFTW